MKYFFLISLFIYSIFYTNISYSLDYKKGQIIQDSFQVSKKFKIDLPPGDWMLIQRNRWSYYGLRAKSNIIVRTENNKVVEGMILEEMHTAGVYEYIINNALNQVVFKGKYDEYSAFVQ